MWKSEGFSNGAIMSCIFLRLAFSCDDGVREKEKFLKYLDRYFMI